jgi:hypothetical protein
VVGKAQGAAAGCELAMSPGNPLKKALEEAWLATSPGKPLGSWSNNGLAELWKKNEPLMDACYKHLHHPTEGFYVIGSTWSVKRTRIDVCRALCRVTLEQG